MKNKRKDVSHKKIVEYWSSQEQNKYGGWLYILPEDIDFPRCQCCGDEKKSWNKLERAHIVPHSLGGKSISSNMVLICKECHLNVPDIDNREYVLKFIEQYTENLFKEYFMKMKQYFTDNNITKEEQEKIITLFSKENQEDFKDFYLKSSSFHRGEGHSPYTIRKIPKYIGIFDKFYQ